MTKLSDFRVDGKPQVEVEVDEIAPLASWFKGRILAVDQSLANSGWAMIEMGVVTWTGNIKTDPMSVGHEDTLLRGERVYAEYQLLLRKFEIDLIVHETPPVSGARMMRPESSLVSAVALRIAGSLAGIPVEMVGAQRAKKRWTGNGNAKKPEVREALKAAFPELRQKKPMNQAIIDALAIGLVVAEERTDGP